MTEIRRHYTPVDRAFSIYQYVPFEVPDGAAAVTVTLAYDRTAAVVDLGLVGPDRFAGWSGGERSVVTVTRKWATPGYLPGALAGEWQVVLGLHRVGPAGVDVALDVDVALVPAPAPPAPPLPPRPARPPRRVLPAASGREWLAADLHSHTVHSDGALEVAELAVLAAGRGLDALAVTDHNTVSHHRFLGPAGDHAGVLLVPGQELTTDRGHANCFGAVGWIDFRQPADAWLAAAAERGGVLAINHPWAGDCAWAQPIAGPAELVEMWHSSWDRAGAEPLAGWRRFGAIPIGGSDFHRPGGRAVLGEPTTWVEVEERSVAGVLDALRAGRVAVSASPASPVLLRVDGELVAVDAEGTTRVDDEWGTRLVRSDRVVAFCA